MVRPFYLYIHIRMICLLKTTFLSRSSKSPSKNAQNRQNMKDKSGCHERIVNNNISSLIGRGSAPDRLAGFWQ